MGGLATYLIGPLGAGKTQLVKGIALGNGLDDLGKVTSPTFTLVHEYPGRLRLYHIDVYRLEGPRDFLRLGPDEWLRPDSAMVIEWADRVRDALPDEAMTVEIAPTGDWSRCFIFTAIGDKAIGSLSALQRMYR